MAPTKKKVAAATVPPFVDDDIEAIKADADFDLTANGTTYKVNVPGHPDLRRTYKLENGDLHYVCTCEINGDDEEDYEDDGEIVPDPYLAKPATKAAAKKKTAPVMEDNLDEEKPKAKAEKPKVEEKSEIEVVSEPEKETKKKPNAKAEKPKVEDKSEIEVVSEPEKETKKKPKAKAEKPKVEEKSESEAESEAEEEPKKKRQVKRVNLNDIISKIDALQINEAKTMLEKFINKHGADGKKKRNVDPNKPKNAYQQFMSEEMIKISKLENEKPAEKRLPTKERMALAVDAWKEHKKTLE